MDWTDERMELLKNLWKDELSASQIAKQLGGVTRNAVIGKLHRLGLSARTPPPSSPTRTKSNVLRKKRVVKKRAIPREISNTQELADMGQAPVSEQPTIEPVRSTAVLTLEANMCRWPIGDPAVDGFAFCGRSQIQWPYCSEHTQVARQPAKKKVGPSELAHSLRRYI